MIVFHAILAVISLLFMGILSGTGRYLFNIGEKRPAMIVYAASIFCTFVYVSTSTIVISEFFTR